MGGAQAIAALAHGTETVPRVDVIVGPGSLWVQEAKRPAERGVGHRRLRRAQRSLRDPLGGGATPRGRRPTSPRRPSTATDSLVVAVSDDPALLPAEGIGVEAADARGRAGLRRGVRARAPAAAGPAAEALAPRVTSAGCVFVGNGAGTAFGDYVAGSNHTLPTEGAARFASGLNTRHFRRRMAEVRIPAAAAAALAPAGAAIARAEGFEAHAQSMEARRENPAP